MWTIIELIFLAAILLVSLTEFFIPLLTGKPFFGSFRKAKTTKVIKDDRPLNAKIDEAKEKVKDVKDIQNAVTEHYKSAEQLKEESDNLLK